MPRHQCHAAVHGRDGVTARGPKCERRSPKYEGTPVTRNRAASVRARLLHIVKATGAGFNRVLWRKPVGSTWPGAADRSVPSRVSGSAVKAEECGHAVQGLGQRGQVLFYDQPDCREINAQVPMHDHVAESGKSTPRNLRLGRLDLA